MVNQKKRLATIAFLYSFGSLSISQMGKFRMLVFNGEEEDLRSRMENNFRSPQPLKGRKVLASFKWETPSCPRRRTWSPAPCLSYHHRAIHWNIETLGCHSESTCPGSPLPLTQYVLCNKWWIPDCIITKDYNICYTWEKIQLNYVCSLF